MIRTDFLPHINYKIQQEEDMYHFNSDTVFLGSFMDIKKRDNVLDIGCNNGALLLYAASFNPLSLTGVDVFEEVIALANTNLLENGFQANFIVSKVQDLKEGNYDVIVCNPPYFKTGKEELKNLNKYKKVARHEEYLTLDALFASVKRLLHGKGRFLMVHRASEYNRIVQIALSYGFAPKRVRFAYGSTTSHAKTVCLEFVRSKTTQVVIERPCFLNDPTSFFTEE